MDTRRFFIFILTFLLVPVSLFAQEKSCNIVYGLRLEPYKPYEWMDDKGPHGMNIDLLKAIAKQAGCSYEIVTASREVLLKKLQTGEVSMLSISPDEVTSKYVTHIPQSIVIYRYVVNRQKDPYIPDMSAWRGKTVLVIKDSYSDNYLSGEQRKLGIKIIRLNTHSELVENLENGRGDFFVASLPSIMNLQKNDNLKINGLPVMPAIYGFAVQKDNNELYDRLNKAMDETKANGDYFEIMHKWTSPEKKPFYIRYILPALALGAFVTALILFWNKSLHYQVRRKTASLNNLSSLLQMLLDVLPEQIYLISEDGTPKWSNTASKDGAFSIDLIAAEIKETIKEKKSFKSKLLLNNAQTWAISGIILEKGDDPLLLVASNITEAVRSREEALMTDRMAALGYMSANVAHEINNPVGLMIHNISFLKGMNADMAQFISEHQDGEQFLGMLWDEAKTETDSAWMIIWENVLRIKNTVDELKEFGKKRDNIYKQVDMKECVEKSVRFIGFFVKSFTSGFECIIEEPILPVYGQKQHIEQVIINLIQNACYALTDSSQKIVCTLKPGEDGKYMMVSVADEGRGMSKEVLKMACNPFFTTRDNGTGLGLSIVASIVKEHNGFYKIESEEGKGTVFSVFFPGSAE